MSDIHNNIDEMITLLRKKIDLLGELKRALMIADLVGIPPRELKQRITTGVRGTGNVSTYNPKPWLHMIYTVRVGDGAPQEFPLKEVPLALWPDDMAAAYHKHKKYMTTQTINRNKE